LVFLNHRNTVASLVFNESLEVDADDKLGYFA
jgi:hypothetical protein